MLYCVVFFTFVNVLQNNLFARDYAEYMNVVFCTFDNISCRIVFVLMTVLNYSAIVF